MMSEDVFQPWLSRWRLVPDGEAICTHSSLLLPVQSDGVPAMLKIATAEEEVNGAHLMAWYAGNGAARVLAHEGSGLLLERLSGQRNLIEMERSGRGTRQRRSSARLWRGCTLREIERRRKRYIRWRPGFASLSLRRRGWEEF